ncbi:MAG: T9SS type A sorting domain-containing protein [Flavobacteriaceae bacterium]|nr:T9SS type A sorting domain-containing protein [Flavobacteriaceae bacterium]
MKKITQTPGKLFSTFLLLLIAISVKAQLHSAPTCGENFTLDWASAPVAPNEYNWLPAGSLSNTYTDVDTSGIDFSVTFTGDTSAFGIWGGAQTPKIGTSAASGLYEGMDLLTMGYAASGITCTINFSSPIFALSFDLYHVNTTGVSGDKYTISAQTSKGDTIYPTFTNSANPSYTTDNSTGVVNANTSSIAGTDAIVGVNFLDNSYITSITFLWQDCLTCTPGNIHGSGLGNFSFCIPQTLDFDGANDFIHRSAFLGKHKDATMMSWVKLDDDFIGGEIMGQRNFRLFVDSSNRLKAFVKTNGSGANSIVTPDIDAPILSAEKWNHVTAIYNGSDKTFDLYLNGENVWSYTGLTGSEIDNSSAWNSDHDFEIGRNTELDNNYFKGSIYECRVYKKALTESQLHHQVNQEIESNGAYIKGIVLQRDITGLSWSDLELYYKMDIVNTGVTPDASVAGVNGSLNNMRTYQERTAPMPYVTKSGGDGDWANENNWLYGNLWDITGAHPVCAIVKIEDNIETSTGHETLGLLISAGSKLEIKNDQGLGVSSYLKLDGVLDLTGESQLIQSLNSELDITSTGSLERDQQGRGDVYSYNYWSSPVSPINTTANNTDYSVADVLYDGTDTNNPQPMNFATSGYNGAPASGGTAATIADYWIFKFVNQSYLYNNWYLGWVRSTGTMKVGEGYTQKGTGTGGATQNYVFIGKPNNGTISHTISPNNTSVLGNPYPSAIDAHQFIADNTAALQTTDLVNPGMTGTLYFWEHWGGGTHVYADYQGGYATLNILGKVKAISDPEVSGIGTGTIVPERYIPVGQGFYIQGSPLGGTIEFNNNQRIFKKEGGESVFFKTAPPVGDSSEEDDGITRIYFNFTTPDGPSRELLLGVKSDLAAGINYGYDGRSLDEQPTDCSFKEGDVPLVIQGIPSIYAGLELPLEMKIGNGGLCKFQTSGTIELPEGLEMFFVDKELFTETKLEEGSVAGFNLTNGVYNDRFYLVFKQAEVLDVEDVEVVEIEDNLIIYYSTATHNVIISNPKGFSAKNISLYNILGQEVLVHKNEYTKVNEVTIPVSIAAGTYVVRFNYNDGTIITKKLLIK